MKPASPRACERSVTPAQPPHHHLPDAWPAAPPHEGRRHRTTRRRYDASRGAAAGRAGSCRPRHRPHHTSDTCRGRQTTPSRTSRRPRLPRTPSRPPASFPGARRRARVDRWGNGADRGDQGRQQPSGWLEHEALVPISSPYSHCCQSWLSAPCDTDLRRFRASSAAVFRPKPRLTLPADPRTLRHPPGSGRRQPETPASGSPVNRPPRSQSVKRSCSSTATSPGPNCMRS